MNPLLYKAILLDQRISHGAFRLWHLLRDYRNHKTGLCFPTLRTLAGKLGGSINAVKRWRNELQRTGYLVIANGGPRKPSFYTFTEPKVMYPPVIHKSEVMYPPRILRVSTMDTELNRLNVEEEKAFSFSLEEVEEAAKRLGMHPDACPDFHQYHSKRKWKEVTSLDGAIRYWMRNPKYQKYLKAKPARPAIPENETPEQRRRREDREKAEEARR